MAHSIPALKRCRGIYLGDGNYTGCAYGDGGARPLTGPMDCPTCNGSGYEGVAATIVPHADFGDAECPGLLFGITKGWDGLIGCNDCDAVVRVVPAAELQEMELSLDSCSEICPHC